MVVSLFQVVLSSEIPKQRQQQQQQQQQQQN